MVELCFNTFNRSAFLEVDPDLPGHVDAAAAGFRLIGPDVFSLDAHRAASGSLDDLVRRLDERGVRVFELAALSVFADEEVTDLDAQRVAAYAATLGAPWVLTNVYDAPTAQVVRAFRRAADTVRDAGARLAVEFMPISAIGSLDEALAFLDASGVDDSGVLIDTWHVFRGATTLDEIALLPASCIAYVQFDDALPMIGDDLMHETLHRRVMPGEGELDLRAFCETVLSTGFDGVVSIEVLNDELRSQDPHAVAPRAYASTAPYWGLATR